MMCPFYLVLYMTENKIIILINLSHDMSGQLFWTENPLAADMAALIMTTVIIKAFITNVYFLLIDC